MLRYVISHHVSCLFIRLKIFGKVCFIVGKEKLFLIITHFSLLLVTDKFVLLCCTVLQRIDIVLDVHRDLKNKILRNEKLNTHKLRSSRYSAIKKTHTKKEEKELY
jgi:hypothetical protein